MSNAFYNETKWCPCCETYVRYLASIEHSYCVECGGEVRLFSKDDWESFNDSMAAKKPKGGRPRKNAKRGASAA